MLIAIEESLPELEHWMSWAQTMPTSEWLHEVLRQDEIDFGQDRGWDYAIFDLRSGDLVGGAGLHRSDRPERFEIGYWVRSSRTGRGI